MLFSLLTQVIGPVLRIVSLFLIIIKLLDKVCKVAESKVQTVKRVSFKCQAEEIPIPSFRDYPASVKSLMWRSTKEIRKMAERNYFEFDYEGQKWRDAVEDEEMMLDHSSGNLIHPAHFNSKYSRMYIRYR